MWRTRSVEGLEMRFSGTKSDADYGHSWKTLNLNLTQVYT
jgi:hypothetical protein